VTFLLILGSFVCFVSVLFSCQEIETPVYVRKSIFDSSPEVYLLTHFRSQTTFTAAKNQGMKCLLQILPHLPIAVLSFILKLALLNYIGYEESFGSPRQCLEGHGFHHSHVVARFELVRWYF